MQQLAAAIREQIDPLVDRYDARLRTMPGYSSLPEAMRRDLERRFLNLIIESLEVGDYSTLAQYAQQRASQWDAQGLNLTWFQQALLIPEEILTPLIRSAEASNFLWRALNRSQGVVWQMVAERAQYTEERFRSIIETAHSGVLITDDAFHLTYVNEELELISGYTREELLGVDFRQLLDEESRQIVADRYLRRQGGEAISPRYEVAFLRKDGTKRYIEMSAVSLKDLNGKQYTVAQVLDVTERQQAVAALAQERNLLRTLIDALPDQVFVKDTQGHILLYNQSDARAMRVDSTEAAVGKTVFDFYPRELAETYHADDMAVIRSERPLYDREEPALDETGQERWVLTTKLPLKDEAGNRWGLVGVARDITRRKQAEMALRENEERLRAIYEGSNDAVMLLNAQGFFDCNTQTLKLFGVDSKDVFVRLHPSDLSPAYQPNGQDSLTLSQQKIKTAYEQGYNRFDWIHRRLNGEEFPAEVLLSAFEYGGRQVLQATVRDITERKQAEAQVERRLQETRIRFEVSQALAGEKTEEQVLAAFIQQAGIYPQALVTLATFDKVGDELVAVARCAESFESGLTPNLPTGTRFPFSAFPLLSLLSADQPLVSQDTFADERMDPASIEITRGIGAAGFAVFPLTAGNEWLGYMMVFAKSTHFFDEGKQYLYQTLAEQGAAALQTARLRDQIQASLERRGRQVQLSTEVAQDIAAAPGLSELFRRVVTLIKERFNYYHAQLFRFEPTQDVVVLITGYGDIGQKMLAAGHKLQLGQGVVGTAAATGHSLLAADVRQSANWRPNPHLPDTKGELAVPIKLRDQVLGILDVQSDRANALTDEDRLLLEGLCGQIASAIESTRLLDETHRTEEFLSSLVDSLPIMIFVKEAQELRFIRWNKAAEDLTGLKNDEIIGKNDYDFFPQEEADSFTAKDREVLAGKVMVDIAEEPLQTRQQGMRLLHTRKVPILDEQGRPQYLLGISEDITERKRVEETLNRERTLLRTLIDNLPLYVYIKDRNSRFVINNNLHLRVMGAKTQEEVVGKNDSDFFPPDLAAQYYADEQSIMQLDQPLINREELVIEQSTGQHLWVSSTKFPLHDEQGQVTGFVGVTQDITERKRAEAERERLFAEQLKRAVQLQTASEVSRAASSILNAEELLPQAAELIRARFSFYYVGIFLTDETKRWAVLRAGTGSAGQQMLVNRHQLEIGGNSMIGQCLVTQQARIALDVGEEAVHFDNPLLPLTHSEMALPLISRGHTIGAMTIQSDQPAAFAADDIAVLQSMADQIANAVENARLYEQAQIALADTDNLLRASAELNVSQSYDDVLAVIREHTALGRDALSVAINVFDRPWTVHQAPQWIELIGYSSRRTTRMEVGTRFPLAVFASAYTLLRADAPTLLEDLSVPEVDANTRALFRQQLGAKSVIFVPLVVGGQWVGYINVLFAEQTQFREADVRRLEALVGQAAVAVQNMRNLAGAQQALTETEASYRATQAIGRAQSAESILEAATPVVQLMGLTRATLRMITRRDLNGMIAANDYYAYQWTDDQWVLQPVLKDTAVNDSASLKPLLRNPEEVMIYKDAQNLDSPMPEDMRRALTADGLRSAVATSVNVQNEVIGFLVFSGPQALAEAAEQRIRLTVGTLSEQIAVALQNRQLFEQTRAALEEVDAINRRLTGEAWESYLRQQAGREVIWAVGDEAVAPDTLSQLDDQLAAGEITIEPDPEDQTEATVTAPILLRGQPIGALRLRTPLDEWTDDTQMMLADIADHIAQAVENARLIEQTQRTAQRERMINEINARVRQAVDLDAILRTAVNELGQSLKAARVVARVGPTAAEGTPPTGDGRGKTND